VEPVQPGDGLRIAELVSTVVVAAERLGFAELATLDRRHFTVVRPAQIPAFELLR
jgi:hypothetical protein